MPRLHVSLLAAVVMACCDAPARGQESIHFGYDESQPAMTDHIRLSTRIGYDWWSSEERKFNVENGQTIPYAYHDAYPEWIADGTLTPQQAADRWRSIMLGNGDPRFPTRNVGTPTVIVLDEIGTEFSDADAAVGGKQGGKLRQALDLYFNMSGSRSHIIAVMSPGLSQQIVTPSNYNDLVYCANSRLRWMGLELYCTYGEFLNGRGGLTGDAYLARFLTQPMRSWITTCGMFASRVRPVLLVSNLADGGRTNYHQFLNRQFWFMRNGWYNAARTQVDNNVKSCMQGGVGSYIWRPGTGQYDLNPAVTARDAQHEQYFYWYCVQGNTAAHAHGLAPLP